MVPLLMGVGKLLRPHHPDKGKLSTYECGEIPIGDSWVQFNLRFYVIAILFLVFEVEVVLMLPVATMFRHWMASADVSGWLVLAEIVVFLSILWVGFAYAWYMGDLQWIRPALKPPHPQKNT